MLPPCVFPPLARSLCDGCVSLLTIAAGWWTFVLAFRCFLLPARTSPHVSRGPASVCALLCRLYESALPVQCIREGFFSVIPAQVRSFTCARLPCKHSLLCCPLSLPRCLSCMWRPWLRAGCCRFCSASVAAVQFAAVALDPRAVAAGSLVRCFVALAVSGAVVLGAHSLLPLLFCLSSSNSPWRCCRGRSWSCACAAAPRSTWRCSRNTRCGL